MVGSPSGDTRGYLLDTNIIVAALAKEQAVLEKVEEMRQALYLPVTALGELHFGACKSTRVEKNLHRIQSFAERAEVLPCDEETARLYGKVKENLRRSGRPIPENDIWISAIALQHDLTLVSRDSHFRHVEGLKTENWQPRPHPKFTATVLQPGRHRAVCSGQKIPTEPSKTA